MQHSLEKEATTSPSIDANKATSIDVKPQTSQIPAEPEILAEKKDDWEITYINTKIHDVYNPLNNNVDWLSTRIDLLQQDLDTICKKDQQPATSIDICTITSIDIMFADMEDRLQTYEDMHDRLISPIMRYLDSLSTQMMKVQKDIGKLNDQHDFQEEDNIKALHNYKTMKERLEKRCDDIYFPFDVRLGGLDSQAEWLQKEVKAIQRKLASQHQISASIDRARFKSIDSTAPATIDRHMVASIDTTSTPDDEQLIHNKMESMHEELNELSAYTYDKIGWHKFSIENILERLQDISNAIQKIDERWTKNDQATRNSTKDAKVDQPAIHTCLDCLKEPKLTSNTKPDIITCLGAWYTWDRIIQTSLKDLGSQLSSFDHKKVSIDDPIGISIDTPFANIDRLSEDNIDRCY
ncbi:hypothetical protein DY000_02024594 [Brassica cretica]|uniref:Uncharacterized protein n=1 Tax=Brassica cretica TaxID=69181 RepID=A0ABQ7E0K0_BRACR|nr:hypothetical protein DY000_02024594 [Brassica cretica]